MPPAIVPITNTDPLSEGFGSLVQAGIAADDRKYQLKKQEAELAYQQRVQTDNISLNNAKIKLQAFAQDTLNSQEYLSIPADKKADWFQSKMMEQSSGLSKSFNFANTSKELEGVVLGTITQYKPTIMAQANKQLLDDTITTANNAMMISNTPEDGISAFQSIVNKKNPFVFSGFGGTEESFNNGLQNTLAASINQKLATMFTKPDGSGAMEAQNYYNQFASHFIDKNGEYVQGISDADKTFFEKVKNATEATRGQVLDYNSTVAMTGILAAAKSSQADAVRGINTSLSIKDGNGAVISANGFNELVQKIDDSVSSGDYMGMTVGHAKELVNSLNLMRAGMSDATTKYKYGQVMAQMFGARNINEAQAIFEANKMSFVNDPEMMNTLKNLSTNEKTPRGSGTMKRAMDAIDARFGPAIANEKNFEKRMSLINAQEATKAQVLDQFINATGPSSKYNDTQMDADIQKIIAANQSLIGDSAVSELVSLSKARLLPKTTASLNAIVGRDSDAVRLMKNGLMYTFSNNPASPTAPYKDIFIPMVSSAVMSFFKKVYKETLNPGMYSVGTSFKDWSFDKANPARMMYTLPQMGGRFQLYLGVWADKDGIYAQENSFDPKTNKYTPTGKKYNLQTMGGDVTFDYGGTK